MPKVDTPTPIKPKFALIPDALKADPSWVLWSLIDRGGKTTKIPFQQNGKFASSTNPNTWCDYETAVSAYNEGGYSGIGFVLSDNSHFCGADFDHCRNQNTGKIDPRVLEAVKNLDSYSEISPSGEGVRVVFAGSLPGGKNVAAGDAEFYQSGRYLTITGHCIKDRGVEQVSADTLVAVRNLMIPQQAHSGNNASVHSVVNPSTIVDLRSALTALSSDDRDAWVNVCHVLKTLGDQGHSLFIEWSQKSDKYDARDAERVWDSCKPTKTGYQAIFAKAQRAGWVNPKTRLDNCTRTNDRGPAGPTIDHKNPLSWTGGFVLSDAEIDSINDPEWVTRNLVIQSHVIAIVSEPNGGKTTILLYQAGEMARQGYEVYYVNADTAGGDAKPMHRLAKEKGFTMMLPDMVSGGLSMGDVVKNLAAMNDTPADFSRVVFIFDTLKKMTDVINKSKAKTLYNLMRSLSSKGMTIILLAHTNKYKGEDGEPIYEGTGDLRSDVDELIYLIPEKREDGTMLVTTKPDKVRGAFLPVTFKIDADRKVELMDQVVDTTKHRAALIAVKRDSKNIRLIDEAIDAGCATQKAIVDFCDERDGVKRYTTRRVLGDYSVDMRDEVASVPRSAATGLMWGKRRTDGNNHLEYQKLLPEREFDLEGAGNAEI